MELLMGEYANMSEARNEMEMFSGALEHESIKSNLIYLIETRGTLKGNILRLHCNTIEASELINKDVFLSYGILIKNGVSGGISIIGEHQFLRLINAGLIPLQLYNKIMNRIMESISDLNYIPVSGVIPRSANVLFLIYRILHTLENVSKFGLEDYMFQLVNSGMLSMHDSYLQITKAGLRYLSYFRTSYLYADSTALLDFLIKRMNIVGRCV